MHVPAVTGQARVTVKLGMWGLSAAVVCGAGGYWYLSYVYLSWDIMVRGRSASIVVRGVLSCKPDVLRRLLC